MKPFVAPVKLEVYRYALKARGLYGGTRTGALLRATFADFSYGGVSDLFPWSEYGDPSLEEWIEELKSAFDFKTPPKSVPLLRALEAAYDEAEAISRGEPLVKGSIVNHALATDPVDLSVGDVLDARRSGCPSIKIKIGKNDPLKEAAALSRLVSHWAIKLRLDANERVSRDQLMIFLDALPILIRESIEFIEDPFVFDQRGWSDFHRETGIPIAYDRGTIDRDLSASPNGVKLSEIFESEAAQILIHKPAWQFDERAHLAKKHGRPVVVTSILGHPVGNLWAAQKAFELAPDGVHGCRSHTAYLENEASATLVKSKQVRGCRVVGLGVGLGLKSNWWDRIRWQPIAGARVVKA